MSTDEPVLIEPGDQRNSVSISDWRPVARHPQMDLRGLGGHRVSGKSSDMLFFIFLIFLSALGERSDGSAHEIPQDPFPCLPWRSPRMRANRIGRSNHNGQN